MFIESTLQPFLTVGQPLVAVGQPRLVVGKLITCSITKRLRQEQQPHRRMVLRDS